MSAVSGAPRSLVRARRSRSHAAGEVTGRRRGHDGRHVVQAVRVAARLSLRVAQRRRDCRPDSLGACECSGRLRRNRRIPRSRGSARRRELPGRARRRNGSGVRRTESRSEVHPLRVTRGALRASTVSGPDVLETAIRRQKGVVLCRPMTRPVKGMAGAMFAAIMMVTLGVFQAIEGLVAHLQRRLVRQDRALHVRSRCHRVRLDPPDPRHPDGDRRLGAVLRASCGPP